ncbi:MAG TPA: pitrilysin family protein [Gemmatimonadales bacterium]|nr:pitrilysin family protein [Gemmatimonadales bacterium]
MRTLPIVGAFAALWLLPCAAQAPPATPPPAPAPAPSGAIAYTTFTLPNGLRVIAAEDHSAPIVAVDIRYDVGSRNERPGRTGFAHLFEHMMFEGSAHAPKGLHSHLIEAAGGQDNASTAEDRTNYFATVPSNYLNVVLWLEADRMRALAITDETFHNQRETVKEERRLRVDNEPYGAAFTDALVWPFDSASCFPYAHTVIGSMADLDRAEVADVHAFFDTYYAPNNATLVVSGDFKALELRSLINQYFATIPRHPDPPKPVCDFKFSPGAVRRTITDPHANLPAVMRLYRIPPHRHPDTFALGVLLVILGTGQSSRLNVSVVRHDQAALAADVTMNPYDSRRGPGILAVFAIANRGVTTGRLDSLVARQLDSLRTTEVSDAELTKAKNIFRARFIRSRETALGRAQMLQHYIMFHGSLAEVNTDLDRYLAVTAADVKRVAATYLDSANMVQATIEVGGGGNQ